MVDGSTADYSPDVRLDRRLKRKAISNERCKNLRYKASKHDRLYESDADYRKFSYKSPKFLDSSDMIVEAKPVNFDYDNDCNGTSRCNSMDEKDDPIYKIFFQHLTAEGKAYKLEIPSVNGMKMYVKYEEKEKSCPKNDQCSRIPGTNRILKSASKKDEIESPVPLFEEECTKPMSHGVNGSSSTMPNEGLSSAEHLSRSDFDLDIVDKDYMTFLTNFRYDGRRLIFSPVYGRSLVYEDDESTSNSEVVMMGTNPGKRSPGSFRRKYFHPTIDSGNFLQSPGICRGSNFRERLMKFLEKPYDQREYDFFLKEVSCQRQHVRYRELRNRVLKPYTLESQAESYLHLYGELAKKIQSVQYDCPRTLNLLRGFFFWLQNLSHEDNFQPWMDPSCLDVLPRS